MTDFRQAAEKAMNLGKQLKAVVEVGEFLEGIADAEQLAREANEAAEAATKRRDEVSEALADEEMVLRAAVERVGKAKEEAEKVSRDAKAVAAVIVAEANGKADKIVKEATAQAEKAVAQARVAFDAHNERMAKLAQEETAVVARLGKLKAELLELHKRLLGEP